MNDLGKDKLTDEEINLIAPCGIYCGACDMMLGRSMSHANEMYSILNGFNFADVGPYFLGMESEKVTDFLNILERWSAYGKCPGCFEGESNNGCLVDRGNRTCPVKSCAKEKNYLTCAECELMPCKGSSETQNLFQDAAALLELISKRYTNWNIRNLERIKEIGYREFLDEMQQKVKDGFITSDIVSNEMVFTETIAKIKGKG